MKTKFLLPFLCISLLFSGCVETITRKTGHNTVPLKFSTDREELNGKILELIPSEEINISTVNIDVSGEGAYDYISVEISGPREFPSGGFEFSDKANEIAGIIKGDIKNIGQYEKIAIEVKNTLKENNTEHTRTFKKEIDL